MKIKKAYRIKDFLFQQWGATLWLAIAMLLSSCGIKNIEAKAQLQGKLWLWHFFEGKEAEVLNQILDKYTELYPKVKIVRDYIAPSEITEQFIQQTQSASGPDLMIVRYRDLNNLIQSGSIQALNKYNIDLSTYLPVAVDHVRFQNQLYGLPFALNLQVLCYNRQQVTEPAKTLSALLKAAQSGQRVGLPSHFLAIFWGISIFDDKPFKPIDTEGRATLERGSFAQWLEWLKRANREPAIILNDARSSLNQAFAEEKLAYYVCNSDEIAALKAVLGEDKLGVALLPGEADRAAGPLLTTTAIVFNRASSIEGRNLALNLTQFLTNVEQQTQLALSTESQIPVNNQVKIDGRLSPIQATLLAQSRTSVAVPLEFDYFVVSIADEYGTLLYNRVLEGELSPTEAAAELNKTINLALGRD